MKKYLIGTIAMITIALSLTVAVDAASGAFNTGNGAGSFNVVSSFKKTVKKVNQTNIAGVSNSVGATQNTGGNHTNSNTGPGTVVNSAGPATSNIGVETNANVNAAAIADCGCLELNGGTSAANTGNGAHSVNSAKTTEVSKTVVNQVNSATVLNIVTSNSTTGGNKANSNTGGSVGVGTGAATSNIGVSNNLNTNEAVVGGFGLGL